MSRNSGPRPEQLPATGTFGHVALSLRAPNPGGGSSGLTNGSQP